VLYLRRRHLDALFLINAFVNKITCPFILKIVGLRVPSKIITDQSMFTTHHCAKASPSTRFVKEATVVCSKIDIFNHQGMSLKNLIRSNMIWFRYYCITTTIPTVHTIFRCLFMPFINFLLSVKWPGIILQFCNSSSNDTYCISFVFAFWNILSYLISYGLSSMSVF
jgi:hypothetical protein